MCLQSKSLTQNVSKMNRFFKTVTMLATSLYVHGAIYAQDLMEWKVYPDALVSIMCMIDNKVVTAVIPPHTNDCFLQELHDDGSVINTQIITEDAFPFEFMNSVNGQTMTFSSIVSGDTTFFRKFVVNDDLGLECCFSWYTEEDVEPSMNSKRCLTTSDGGTIITYILKGRGGDSNNRSNAMTKLVKFDALGNLVAEQVFSTGDRSSTYSNILPSSDSLGCRVVVGRIDEQLWLVYDCFTMDATMNVVDVKENLENLSYPYVPRSAYYRLNPSNGRIYSIGYFHQFTNQGIKPNLIMNVYDNEFNQLAYRTCPWVAETGNYTHGLFNIDFGPNDEVYTSNGYIYKVTMSDFLSVKDAHSHDFTVATAYPNPSKDELNIRTALQNARVEIYDLNGRLMHMQEITANTTPIMAAEWPAGTYVWKVFSNGKEAETGKWIKE